jgi:hypothetical protein
MTRLLSLLIGLMILTPHVNAQAATTVPEVPSSVSAACVSQVHQRMAQQQRIYRTILFGRRDARIEAVGTARYDEEGNAWLKTAPDTWQHATGPDASDTRSDGEINANTEWEGMNETQNVSPRAPRDGLFATTGELPSGLVQPSAQAWRALRCRAEMVCESLRATLRGEGDDGDTLTVETPGCVPLKTEPLDQCVFQKDGTAPIADEQPQILDALSDTVVQTHCLPLLEEMVQREAEVLKMSFTYAASYQTLLQFAGNFDRFLAAFRGDLLKPIEDMLSVVGYLTRIPCFIAACNG